MSLEDKHREQTTVVDKSVFPVANYTMSVRDYVVRPSATPASGPFTIELPPVGKARGKFYSIVARNADAVNAITLTDNNSDSECWEGDFTLNGKCDAYLMYSDGMKWHQCNAITTYVGTTTPPTTAAPTTAGP